jgi:hypothetical protein
MKNRPITTSIISRERSMPKSTILMTLVKKLISLAQRFGVKTQSPGTFSDTPAAEQPESFLLFWLLLLVSLPLDIIMAPVLFSYFSDALLLINTSTRELLFILSFLLMALPLLFREQLIRVLLSSQAFQSESRLITSNFQGIIPAFIGIYILADLAARIITYGWEWVLALIGLSLFSFPFWYGRLKRKVTVEQREVTPSPGLFGFVRALKQFELLFITLYLIARVGTFLSIGFAHVQHLSFFFQFCIVGTALLLFFSARPSVTDFFRTCRKCGYTSHRALQIEGKCPGCHKLALKSYTSAQNQMSHSRLYSLMERIDQALESSEAKLHPRNLIPLFRKKRSQGAPQRRVGKK